MTTMHVFRFLVTLVVVLPTVGIIYSLISLEDRWIPILVSATVAGFFMWSQTRSIPVPRTLGSSLKYGALVGGKLGIFAGLVGPIVLTPEANLGPMVGMFVMGPFGVLLGALAGFIWWKDRKQ